MLIDNPTSKIEPRLWLLRLLVVAAAAVLILTLHRIQVKEGELYAASLRNQTTVPVVLSPARGSIVDCNGIGLAENRASIDIDVYLRELVGYYSRSKRGKLPKTNVPGRSVQMADVATILEESTGNVFDNLALKKEFTTRELLTHYYQTPNVPFQLVRNLDFPQLSTFSEHSVNIPGIQESARPVRTYNFGALAPHILGYVGRVEEISSDSDFVPESIGKEGIEKTFDAYLQGQPGYKMLRKIMSATSSVPTPSSNPPSAAPFISALMPASSTSSNKPCAGSDGAPPWSWTPAPVTSWPWSPCPALILTASPLPLIPMNGNA
ncbi:MAG: hypothetical protein HC904_12970 [Blastochloris sp.]|nr:hypothetical protein [Blastochloris sp.]